MTTTDIVIASIVLFLFVISCCLLIVMKRLTDCIEADTTNIQMVNIPLEPYIKQEQPDV